MKDCPEYWQNFAREHLDWDDIRQALARDYDAHCMQRLGGDSNFSSSLVIEFNNDELFTLFMLKWS